MPGARWTPLSPSSDLGLSHGVERTAGFDLPGARSPAVHAAIAAIVAARSEEDFVAAARALDRLLLSGFYIVPLFHTEDQWIA